MTILFVTHYAGFYGANKSLLTLMLLLRKKHGVRPIVLLPSEGPMCAQLEKENIPYKVSHYYWWVNYNHGAFQWLLNKRKQLINWLRIGKLCCLFSEEKIDLIYTNSVCVNVGILMAERLGLPHLWQARESLSQFSLSLSLALSRHIWALPANKAHILISNYMMDYYRSYLPNDRMVRIYNGVDLPRGIEERKRNVMDGRLKVACVGILSEQKNQLEILRAQHILRERGVEIETYFFGSAKEEGLIPMQGLISEYGLRDMAHIVGHTEDVFGALQEMNLGVVAARDEAFGRVTVEYMLMHMPVIVSDSGANPELVENGKTGMIYPLGNAERLADCIEYYVKHPEFLQTQGDAAAESAKNNFSAERNAELIYEQIRKCVMCNV